MTPTPFQGGGAVPYEAGPEARRRRRTPGPMVDTDGVLAGSEHELHSELNGSLSGLGQYPSEVGVLRIVDDAAVAGIGVAKVGVVREVEDLEPELQAPRVAERYVLEERHVPALEPGRPEDVPARVAESALGGLLEGLGVEPEVLVLAPALRELGIRDVRVADQVPGLGGAVAHAGDVVTTHHGNWSAGLEEGHARELPASQDLLEDGVLMTPQGQLVDVVDGEDVGAVVVGDAPVARVVVGVEHQVPLVAGVVPDLRQGVGQPEAQPTVETPLQAELQAVVFGPAGVLGEPDVGEAEIGTKGVEVDSGVGLEGARLELVDVALALQVRPHPAHV